MALKNMKLEKKDRESMCEPCEPPLYPYGLCLHLDDESLGKLGLDKLPEVGSKMQVTAVAEVQDVGEFKRHDGKTNRSVRLQITDMELAPQPQNGDATAKLYGE